MRSYESDFAGWAEDTARAICDGRWSEIDRANLADEVADLAREERRAVGSRLEVLFTHLLKKQFQPGKASAGWDITIAEQRERLRGLLDENPSLRTASELSDAITKAYRLARFRAAKETGLGLDSMPVSQPFSDRDIWGED